MKPSRHRDREESMKTLKESELASLYAAKTSLFYYALLFARIATERDDATSVGHKLCMAAKAFTRTVDSIDSKLWEPLCEVVQCPPDTEVQQSKTESVP